MTQPAALSALRRAVTALEPGGASGAGAPFELGLPALDAWLGGGLARGALHEIHAGQVLDAAASAGFGLGLALRASPRRPLVFVRQDGVDAETGRLYGGGVAAFGLDPNRLLVVRARDPTGVLRAAAEAARCSEIGAALVAIRGSPRILDLTASRRLALSAGASGVTLVMIRLGADPGPSAATSRWRVEAAASAPLEANAPGRPAFSAALQRHRSGLGPRTWALEWDRDRASFAAPLPRPEAAVPAGGAAAQGNAAPENVPRGEGARGEVVLWRRAG